MIRCINYDIPLLHWSIWYLFLIIIIIHHIFRWGKGEVFISLSSSAGLRYWSSLGFSPVSPTSAPLAADWSGAFSGAVVLWCRVDGFTKRHQRRSGMLWEKGVANERFWSYELKDDERGNQKKGTIDRQLGSPFILIIYIYVMDF